MAGIGIGNRTLGDPASLPRHRGRSKDLGLYRGTSRTIATGSPATTAERLPQPHLCLSVGHEPPALAVGLGLRPQAVAGDIAD